MSKKRVFYIHIFIWLFAIFANIPYSGIGTGMPPKQIVSNIIGFLYLMVVFYLFYLYIAPLFLNRKKLVAFFVTSFFAVLILPFFGYLLLLFARALFDGTFHDFFNGYSFRTHMSGYYPVLTAAVFGSFFRVILNWFGTMNQKAEIDKQKLAVELDLLKSKLNPHFLFNTLNNIDSLIQQDPEEASRALIKLSGIMRYLTYETSSETVELEREIEYIRNYIDLHRIRIKSPDDIRFEVSGRTNLRISPALFVPLLENAFKYAQFGKTNPCIDINLASDNGTIIFKISNHFQEVPISAEQKPSGFGIANLQKRLGLLYPSRHRLDISKNEQEFNVALTIDTDAD
jgi:two-component system, LytTR family, sensor kinase